MLFVRNRKKGKKKKTKTTTQCVPHLFIFLKDLVSSLLAENSPTADV